MKINREQYIMNWNTYKYWEKTKIPICMVDFLIFLQDREDSTFLYKYDIIQINLLTLSL